jgi:oligopeptide/dipeptide ABC transporter ATP-binding protein
MLSVERVVKDYRLRGPNAGGYLRAVDEVTFSCQEGETVGVVGESGCGKTTLGRLVAGLIRPTAGNVTVRKRNGQQGPARAHSGVQMVYQSAVESLDPRMRIATSISEPLQHLPRAERRERVRNALRDVALSDEQATRYPHELSGGQQQRACIARALVGNPSVVILDEAVSNLDVLLQREVLLLLSELQARTRVAYLFISHDFATVAALSTRLLVMYLGRVLEAVPGREATGTLLHPYSVALQSAQLRPRPDGSRSKPIILAGDPPSAIGKRTGCRFAGRCPLADERCRSEEPPLLEHKPGHFAACYHPGALVPEVMDGGTLDASGEIR